MDAKIKSNYDLTLELTPHTAWSQQFWDDLVPFKDKVSEHPLFIWICQTVY